MSGVEKLAGWIFTIQMHGKGQGAYIAIVNPRGQIEVEANANEAEAEDIALAFTTIALGEHERRND
jgi:hypothetical protein